MRQLLLATLATLFCGCLTEVAHISCSTHGDSSVSTSCQPGEACLDGVCVSATADACVNGCGIAPSGDGDGGLPPDLALSLSLAGGGTSVTSALPQLIDARLTIADAGTSYDLPGPVSLTIRRTNPAPLDPDTSVSLPHAGTGLYEGAATFVRSGHYLLSASLAGTALTAQLELDVDSCNAACGLNEECLAGLCFKVFDYTVVAPVSGPLPTDVEVDVAPHPGAPLALETPLPTAVWLKVASEPNPVALSSNSDGSQWTGSWPFTSSGNIVMNPRAQVGPSSVYDAPATAIQIHAQLSIQSTPPARAPFPGYIRGAANQLVVTSDVDNLAEVALTVSPDANSDTGGSAIIVAPACAVGDASCTCGPLVLSPARSCALVAFDFAGHDPSGTGGPALSMPGLTGIFDAVADGKDSDGVAANQSAPVPMPVTRVRWTWVDPSSAQPAATPLAVLRDGIVVFGEQPAGTSSSLALSVVALGPDGLLKAKATLAGATGTLSGLTALDQPGSTLIAVTESILNQPNGQNLAHVHLLQLDYPATAGGNWSLSELDPSKQIPFAPGLTASVALAWMTLPSPALVVAYCPSWMDTSKSQLGRWDPATAQFTATSLPFGLPPGAHIGLSVSGDAADLGTESTTDSNIRELRFANGAWSAPVEIPVNLGAGGGFVRAILHDSLRQVLAGWAWTTGGVTLFETPATSQFPVATGRTVAGSAITAGGLFLSATVSSAQGAHDGQLIGYPLAAAGAVLQGTLPGAPVGGPLLGASGGVYLGANLAGSNGVQSGAICRADPSAPDPTALSCTWQPGGPLAQPPALDCARPLDAMGQAASGLGSLYLAATDGTLYAISVDDPGLDTHSPWPQPTHDSSNSQSEDGPVGCLATQGN